MTTAAESLERGRGLYAAKRYADAVPLLLIAVRQNPQDVQLWSELVWATHSSEQFSLAISYAKEALVHHPRSGWLWRHLGHDLARFPDKYDEAEQALIKALDILGYNDEYTWRYLADVYNKKGRNDDEINAWKRLIDLEKAAGGDYNRLGMAYEEKRDFTRALHCYRSAVETDQSVDHVAFYRMGVLYQNTEVSEDLNAADAFRRSLSQRQDIELVKTKLMAVRAKLLPLAREARLQVEDLQRDDHAYDYYLNPFQAFQITNINSVDELSELDTKTIQRARKRLLHEIDLSDGVVSWLDGCQLDQSRVFALEDEMLDEDKRLYHWAIFRDKNLLDFLSHGSIELFLYSDDYFPLNTLDLIDDDPQFRTFISAPFARQFDKLSTKAIAGHRLAVVEVLLDGRRWVDPEFTDECFGGVTLYVRECLASASRLFENGKTSKPRFEEIRALLDAKDMVAIFNRLPTRYRSERSQLVGHIISLAALANRNRDFKTAADIIALCDQFPSIDADVEDRLKKDKTLHIENERVRLASLATSREYVRKPSADSGPSDIAVRRFVYGVIVVVILFIIYAVNTSDNTTRTSTNNARSSPSAVPSTSRNNHTQSNQGASGYSNRSESGGNYRVPSHSATELDRERAVIDAERTDLEILNQRLERMGRDIEFERSMLDENDQYEVDRFNNQVDDYNVLAQRFRIRNNRLNEMIDAYNAKLDRYGR